MSDWRALAHRTVEKFTKFGIDLLLDHEALAVDSKAKQVQVRSPDRSNRY